MDIKFVKNENLKPEPDWDNLGFCRYNTDYMFLMDYDEAIGWHDARIVPFGPISLVPDAVVLHYGQETFEGMKAYRRPDGNIQLFRPEMNARRFIGTNRRMCMPELPEEMYVEAVEETVKANARWVPAQPDCSLYIRPFMFATAGMLALHHCPTYTFAIIVSPAGPYFGKGFNPVKILVEDQYVRAVRGGTGFTKCGGNYAGAALATELAEKRGYSQVLWLDGVHRKYVEEAGGMNFMYLMDGTLWTAPLVGTVLPGVTRDSLICLAKSWGVPVREEYMDIEDVLKGIREGCVTEAFACGTAAVIGPIGSLTYKDEEFVINNFKPGDLTVKLYNTMTDIQWGRTEDIFGWTKPVC